MKKRVVIILLVLLLSMTTVSAAIGSDGQPQYGCPDSFELHMAMEHDGEHGHHHIGTDTDLNGDGFICMKHVGNNGNNHVHIDNHVPLP